MLNLKNNESDAVFDEICKKKAKIKIKLKCLFAQNKGQPH